MSNLIEQRVAFRDAESIPYTDREGRIIECYIDGNKIEMPFGDSRSQYADKDAVIAGTWYMIVDDGGKIYHTRAKWIRKILKPQSF